MRPLHLFLFLVFTANGLSMLGWPLWWYANLPGVADTGPFNDHFVRDIGAAYLTCGLSFGALWRRIEGSRAAAFAACGFLSLHAGIHLVEAFIGVHSLAHFMRDLPAVLLLPMLALWSLRPVQVIPTKSDTHGGSYA